MDHREGTLVFALILFALSAGVFVYGLKTGVLPAKGRVVRRNEDPGTFRFGLISFALIALLALYLAAKKI